MPNPTGETMETLSEVAVSEDMARAIQMLEDRLRIEYGRDYSFQILGRGHTLAKSNITGIVKPNVSPSAPSVRR